MKALILAAGKGTRMRELTDEMPKPMLKVQGKSILEWILEGLLSAGIRDWHIVTGFRAEVIEEALGDGGHLGGSITYSRQTVQDGTAKAAELGRRFMGDEPFLLTYGDILVTPSTYQEMVVRFQQEAFSGLSAVTRGEEVARGGLMLFDKNFCLLSVLEKPTSEQIAQLKEDGILSDTAPLWYNAGIYIFQPSLFDYTARIPKSPRGEYELTDAINSMVSDGHRIVGLEIRGRWVDVRDPETLESLERGDR